MKKAIIAGAASAVLAAMPVVGVFAADLQTHTDTIKVTVNPVCTFGDGTSKNVTHSVGSAQGTNASAPANSQWTGDTLSGNMSNGTFTENYGSTSFSVTCNKYNGMTVTSQFNLQDSDEAESETNKRVSWLAGTEPNAETIEFGTGINGTASNWSYKVTATNGGANGGTITDATNASWQSTAGTVVRASAPVSQATFTVTYGMSISATQAADTYTGAITYTLAQAN